MDNYNSGVGGGAHVSIYRQYTLYHHPKKKSVKKKEEQKKENTTIFVTPSNRLQTDRFWAVRVIQFSVRCVFGPVSVWCWPGW